MFVPWLLRVSSPPERIDIHKSFVCRVCIYGADLSHTRPQKSNRKLATAAAAAAACKRENRGCGALDDLYRKRASERTHTEVRILRLQHWRGIWSYLCAVCVDITTARRRRRVEGVQKVLILFIWFAGPRSI